MGRQTVGDIHNLNTLFFKVGLGRKVHFFPYGRAHFIVSLFQSLMCSSTSAKPPSLFPDSVELWSWLCGTHPLLTLALGLLPSSLLVLIHGEHCFSWSSLFFNNSHFTFCPFIHSPLSSLSLLMIGLTFK